jgi:CRP-like cAMP-binding protein
MTLYTAPITLQTALAREREKISKPKGSVLFRRGTEAFGMFVVLSGKVRLDFGVDSALSRTYGPGALVGLPATLTRRKYSMTATVTEEAELSFWNPKELELLLREHPIIATLCFRFLARRWPKTKNLPQRCSLGTTRQRKRHTLSEA